MTRVVGLDLALTKSGMARPEGTLATFKPRGRGYARHWEVAERVLAIVTADAADVVVIEDYAPHGRGINALIACAEVGGIVRAMLHRHDVAFALVRPSTLKTFATGNGNASKAVMLEAANNAGAGAQTDDEADAYWLRQMGRAHYAGAAGPHLDVVTWPELTR